MYKQFQEGNTFRGKAGLCGQPSPTPQNPTTPCRHTGLAWLQLPAGQCPAGLTHLQSHAGQLWLWSSNLQLLPRAEGSSDRPNPNRSARVGCGPRSGAAWFIVLPMYRARRWQCRFGSAGTWHKRVPKMSQNRLFPRSCVKSCPPRGEGSLISRISAKNQACVHGSCIGPCSPGVFESVNITTCLLLPGLDHSGYAPISA